VEPAKDLEKTVTQSHSKQKSRKSYIRWPALIATCLFGLALIVKAEDSDQTGNQERANEALARLLNDEIDWDERGFGNAGPIVKGQNASQVLKAGIGQVEPLIRRLDDPKAVIAAHVCLTKLWRVPNRSKEIFTQSLSDGHFVYFNGLHVRIRWDHEGDEWRKVIDIPDVACQTKRLGEFWVKPYATHSEEFSPDTKLE